MKSDFIWIIFSSVFLFSCKKESPDPIKTENEPKEITFLYNNDSVTYGIIKKIYTLSSKGESLEVPITKYWLDRNLGASRAALVKDDALAMGDLYQWGRCKDGHEKRNSDTTSQLSANIVPGHGKFIARYFNAPDWLTSSNDSLWNNRERTNNPCPKGWRVPNADELAMEMNSWGALRIDSAYSSLKWAAAGTRDNNGIERYAGYWGFVWSSTPEDEGEARALAIIGNQSEMIGSYRISGHSVRCIRDY